MVEPVEPRLWPLQDLASCDRCGSALQPRPSAPSRRFYGCRCPDGLYDADVLEQAVAHSVLDHMRARLAQHAFPSALVDAAWRNATPVARRALLTAALAAVVIDPVGDPPNLNCIWHPD